MHFSLNFFMFKTTLTFFKCAEIFLSTFINNRLTFNRYLIIDRRFFFYLSSRKNFISYFFRVFYSCCLFQVAILLAVKHETVKRREKTLKTLLASPPEQCSSATLTFLIFSQKIDVLSKNCMIGLIKLVEMHILVHNSPVFVSM